jgi:hypothetical protein
VKSAARQYFLNGGLNVAFSTPKEFFEWCYEKNDRMVIERPRPMTALKNASNYMPEPNRPIEIRWLSSSTIENEFHNLLKPRWNQLSPKGNMFLLIAHYNNISFQTAFHVFEIFMNSVQTSMD